VNRPPFALTRGEHRGVPVLAVAGEIDVDTCWQLQQELTTTLSEGDVIIDLSEVAFIDSSGLNVLVSGYRQARTSQHRMMISGSSERVLGMLEVTQLTTLFSLHATVDDAADQLG
jgi:anti-sigma B factor antagonist